jgi:hypothetical protein|eukprot:COSAG06_NODE_4490_length_4208_cov_4.778535_5_plen_54_part_00
MRRSGCDDWLCDSIGIVCDPVPCPCLVDWSVRGGDAIERRCGVAVRSASTRGA